MEKTDTIILSPEELAAYMAESTISVTSTYEHSPVVLMVDDTVTVSYTHLTLPTICSV